MVYRKYEKFGDKIRELEDWQTRFASLAVRHGLQMQQQQLIQQTQARAAAAAQNPSPGKRLK